MKRLHKILIPVFALAIAIVGMAAFTTNWDRETLNNGWKVITFEGYAVAAADTMNSSAFSLPATMRERAFATYPLCAYVDLDSATYAADSAATGGVTYKIYLQGAPSTSGTYATVDTLYDTADSDTTFSDDVWTLNTNLYPLYPYYRIQVQATNVGTADSNAFTIKLW